MAKAPRAGPNISAVLSPSHVLGMPDVPLVMMDHFAQVVMHQGSTLQGLMVVAESAL